MNGEKTHAWVGLRSGNLLEIHKVSPKEIVVDASRVTLSDVAYGIAGLRRFQNQMWRAYTVAEHSVLGSYLTNDPRVALQFLFHDTAEGLGIGDVHFRVKRLFGAGIEAVEEAVVAAVCSQFDVPHPFDPEVKAIDRALSEYEWATLHPAKAAIAEAYGIHQKSALSKVTPAQAARLHAWFSKDGGGWDADRAAAEWQRAVHDTLSLIGRAAYAERVVAGILTNTAFWPIPAKVAVGKIAHEFNLQESLVQNEIDRLQRDGRLVRKDLFLHLPPTASAPTTPTTTQEVPDGRDPLRDAG